MVSYGRICKFSLAFGTVIFVISRRPAFSNLAFPSFVTQDPINEEFLRGNGFCGGRSNF